MAFFTPRARRIKMALFAAAVLLFSAQTSAQFGPPSGYEGMVPPDRMNGDFGPSGDQSEMMNRGLQQMKKGVSNMKRAIAQMEKTVSKVEKAGYAAPQEVTDALAKAQSAIAVIENATAFDDAVQVAIDDFNAFVEVLDMHIQGLNMLANFSRILKQADRTFAKLTTMFEKEKAKAAKSEFDLSQTIAEIQTKIDGLKAAYDRAVAFAKAGNAEDAFTTLEDEYFENMEDVFQSVGMLQAVSNLTKAVKMVEKGIKSAEKLTNNLGKKGKDVSSLRTIIADSKVKLEELRASLKMKDFEPEDSVSILEELDDLRMKFEENYEEISGKNLHGKNGINFFGGQTPTLPKELIQGPPRGEEGASGFEKLDFGF